MAQGKRLLLYSARDPLASSLNSLVADWSCLVSHCRSIDELRGRVQGADYDLVLVEPSAALRPLVGETSDEEVLLPLATVEKRHILRVLAAAAGNKTRAARTLGIDTKTLYNKLQAYQSADQVAAKRTANSRLTAII